MFHVSCRAASQDTHPPGYPVHKPDPNMQPYEMAVADRPVNGSGKSAPSASMLRVRAMRSTSPSVPLTVVSGSNIDAGSPQLAEGHPSEQPTPRGCSLFFGSRFGVRTVRVSAALPPGIVFVTPVLSLHLPIPSRDREGLMDRGR